MKKIIDQKRTTLLFNIVVPVFNSEKYIERCLNSIVKQSYKKFQVQVVDDCSSDSSYEIAYSICEQNKNFKLFRNNRRIGALNNIFNLLHTKVKEPSKTIDVIIDGDDYLYSSDVLNVIEEKYFKTNCLITYGSHVSSKGVQGKKYPRFIREFNLFRKYFWYASHLKTFRHDLWLSINPQDFLNKNREYFSVASDLAIMFPMLEMAGNRQEFISEILYCYNDKNPISDHKIRRKEQILSAKEIRQKKRYNRRIFN
ncbi:MULTISPECIES: glycosyltransferase family 2 protein [Prochlorococcus]|uniref:glycosyltransferase family 2 protein n=1 Tax=Prochlorococcus TaxID=1218 RepID=UPI0003081944|nr:glycosyltransferase family A protein [Prochlorococcus marinus]KGF86325.1 putative Glycosyl transferase [Prochlorococcus marinus str. EQPAC1]